MVSSRERETAVNTLELPKAAAACDHPWFLFFPTFPWTTAFANRGFYQFKITAWELRRHVDKDFSQHV